MLLCVVLISDSQMLRSILLAITMIYLNGWNSEKWHLKCHKRKITSVRVYPWQLWLFYNENCCMQTQINIVYSWLLPFSAWWASGLSSKWYICIRTLNNKFEYYSHLICIYQSCNLSFDFSFETYKVPLIDSLAGLWNEQETEEKSSEKVRNSAAQTLILFGLT